MDRELSVKVNEMYGLTLCINVNQGSPIGVCQLHML